MQLYSYYDGVRDNIKGRSDLEIQSTLDTRIPSCRGLGLNIAQ